MSHSSSSDDEDESFFRAHAKAIAQALQQQDALEQQQAVVGAAATSQSQRERSIHDTYVALCHDDPRVESDLACQYLATALLDPQSPYALSGPLVEGIRQLCAKDSDNNGGDQRGNSSSNEENLTNSTENSSARGSAMLAWTIYARIPLLCCQASDLSEVDAYLGSYRPPPPPNPLQIDDDHPSTITSKIKNEEADHLAALLSQPVDEEEDSKNNSTKNDDGKENIGLEEEVWAAESDPSDFEFESGFSYEQQMADFQESFSAWMIDRTDPLKLSKPTTTVPTTWKQVRHAVMDLTSQLTYRKVASLWKDGSNNVVTSAGGSRGPSDLLKQFTLTLLIPPPISSTPALNNRPSIFDSPDDEEDALQPQRQLQAMAWHPLWVMRDAAAAAAGSSSKISFSQYLSLLQTLLKVDAAAANDATAAATTKSSMAPATYVGLASLSALCQKFVVDITDSSNTNSSSVECFRSLRQSLWETCDDLAHALEEEEKFTKTTRASLATKVPEEQNHPDSKAESSSSGGSDWILWTLLPFFEILTNQRLQNGTTILAKAESMAQRHYHQQSSQQWSGLLQSGLFRQWLLRLQTARSESTAPDTNTTTTTTVNPPSLLWQLLRRSLLYIIAQSMSATSALGKYAWRFPHFASLVEIGESSKPTNPEDFSISTFSDIDVDDILWNLLSMELAGTGTLATITPTVQWRSTTKKTSAAITTIKPLLSRVECQRVGWEGFQVLCQNVVHVLQIACEEENKRENLQSNDKSTGGKDEPVVSFSEEEKVQHQLVLRSFHRFVNSLVACPLLAKLFVHDLEMVSSDEDKNNKECDGGIQKCLDTIQEALSQYKAPLSDTLKQAHSKEKKEDGEEKAEGEIDPKRTKEELYSVSLQEDIHMTRKVLKMLRSLVATKTTSNSSPTMLVPQNVASSSKTD